MSKKDKTKKKLKGFKDGFVNFISRGNVIDLAVGVIIGAAFGKITTSLVGDMLMPLIAAIFGKTSFKDMYAVIKAKDITQFSGKTLEDARTIASEQGASIVAYGNFIQTIIDFLIISFFIYVFVVLIIQGTLKKLEAKKLAKKAQEEPKKEEKPEVPEDIKLLQEINNQLKELNSKENKQKVKKNNK